MKTVEEIYSRMMAAFAAKTGLEGDGCGDLATRLYAVAAELSSLYIQSDWVARQCFPQSATGEYLDRHAALRGVSRRTAAKAEGVLRFAVDGALTTDLAIPVGTVCMTAGLVRFETTSPAVLRAGKKTADVPAAAVVAGAAGNAAAGSILSMAVAPVGVSRCSNPAPFTGGVDGEGDEALRERVLETFQRLPNGANAAFYQQGALSFPQVAAAKVIPRSRGIGTVDVVLAAHAGVPDADLIARVQAYFDVRREIAVDVRVLPPTVKTVHLAVQVKPREGRTSAQVLQSVRSALTGYFTGKLLGEDVLRAKLGDVVFGVDGVANYTVTEPSSDLTMAVGELPTLGTLTVEAMT